MKFWNVTTRIVGFGPISWGRYLDDAPAGGKQTLKWDQDNCHRKFHANDEGQLQVPVIALKHAVTEAAKFDGRTIPGGGKKTYTKIFAQAATPVQARAFLADEKGKPYTYKDLKVETLHVPSDGTAGGGRRVFRAFPLLDKPWHVQFDFQVMDHRITKEVWREFLNISGLLVGLGRWRPQNRGAYGRYAVREIVKWEELDTSMLVED